MQSISKAVWKEEFHYYSEKSIKSLKMEMDYIFKKTRGWDFSINLTGKFVNEDSFKITPKWEFVYIQNFETSSAYLNGRIYEDDQKRTRVSFNLRPNSIHLIGFFAFPLIGLIFLLSALKSQNAQEVHYVNYLIFGVIFTVLIPVCWLFIGYFFKHLLKDRFVSTFKLKPLKDKVS